jgi:preprotein translocase subunit SecA
VGEPLSPESLKLVAAEMELLLLAPFTDKGKLAESLPRDEAISLFSTWAGERYDTRETEWGGDLTREIERRVMLSVIDEKWRDHLYEMDLLKEGIGLRAWGQKDPLIEYKREAYNAFEAMMGGLGEDVIRRMFRVSVVAAPNQPVPTRTVHAAATQESHAAFSAFDRSETATATSAPPRTSTTPVRVQAKVGRNDPCPCGSGKKYKKCHGQ